MREKDCFAVGCEGMRLELIRVADDMTWLRLKLGEWFKL